MMHRNTRDMLDIAGWMLALCVAVGLLVGEFMFIGRDSGQTPTTTTTVPAMCPAHAVNT